MPLSKSEYVSDIWKDGIFGRSFAHLMPRHTTHISFLFLSNITSQPTALSSAPVVLALYAALKSEPWFISAPTLAS